MLNRDFTASAPNQKWLADIPSIDTQEGFLYLAGVEDVFSRRIVGWAMGNSLETALVERVLLMALGQRQSRTGLMHHADRGSQYASLDYRRLLASRRITVRMSRTGNCYDNIRPYRPGRPLRDMAMGMGANEFMARPFHKATPLDYVGKYISKPQVERLFNRSFPLPSTLRYVRSIRTYRDCLPY